MGIAEEVANARILVAKARSGEQYETEPAPELAPRSTSLLYQTVNAARQRHAEERTRQAQLRARAVPVAPPSDPIEPEGKAPPKPRKKA